MNVSLRRSALAKSGKVFEEGKTASYEVNEMEIEWSVPQVNDCME